MPRANPTPADKSIGDALFKARTTREMTQADLAKALGMTHVAISRWESGDRSPMIKDIPRIAKALKLKPLELAAQLLDGVSRSKR